MKRIWTNAWERELGPSVRAGGGRSIHWLSAPQCRAMIYKVENGGSSSTANLLGKLSGAFGLSISTRWRALKPARSG
ncbi:hypothetical protein WSK_1792 [Novosphingobium sp. Rr 2-17]|nr:hypothetical protein WSK_1792 [Novosphingobium sp. Rr 2-17]